MNPAPPTFPLRRMLGESWEIFKANFLLLFIAHLVFNSLFSMTPMLLLIGSIVLVGPLWHGVAKIALAVVRKEEADFPDIFAGFLCFLPTCYAGAFIFLLTTLLTTLFACPLFAGVYWALSQNYLGLLIPIIAVGGTLCLLPTCGVIALYAPSFFFICDGASGHEALRKSRQMVLQAPKAWLRLWALLSLIHVAGLLCFLVGVYIVTPWMVVLLALGYEHMRKLPPPMPTTPAKGV